MYSYSYSSGVQINEINDFSSKLHSLPRNILKAVSVRKLFPTKSIGQNWTNDFNSSLMSPNIICLIQICCLWRIKGEGYNVCAYIYMHMYIIIIYNINSTPTCTLVYNTQIYAFRDNYWYTFIIIYYTCPILCFKLVT